LLITCPQDNPQPEPSTGRPKQVVFHRNQLPKYYYYELIKSFSLEPVECTGFYRL
jgi:hypothetical protein